MDVIEQISSSGYNPITCVEMHTTGEPTRIVISGYPEIHGTLLQQREEARSKHDQIRRRLLLEPRGHFDMYGAILRPKTELTEINEAHIGVLFMTNDGYSTMCGHATIALGRFLLDTHDLKVFPNRNEVQYDSKTSTAVLNLHAPCGVVKVTVPVTKDGTHSDLTRPVSFISVPSFTIGIQIEVPVHSTLRETLSNPSIALPTQIKVDFSYGGAFFAIVKATDLGLVDGLKGIDFQKVNNLTKELKEKINNNPNLKKYFTHPLEPDLSFLYSIIITDDTTTENKDDTIDSELGLCYFSNQQIDRSPTGSGVSARIALAYAKGQLRVGQKRMYHSFVSNTLGKEKGGFTGCVVEDISQNHEYPVVRVQVEGFAYYTGVHTFVVEKEDFLGDDGFIFQELNSET